MSLFQETPSEDTTKSEYISIRVRMIVGVGGLRHKKPANTLVENPCCEALRDNHAKYPRSIAGMTQPTIICQVSELRV